MISLVLKHRLFFAPVLLTSVVKPFAGMQHVARFYGLVDEYLPEEKARLLKLAPTDAAGEFIKAFSKRYFPLNEHVVLDSYSDFGKQLYNLERLNRAIPLTWEGMDEGSYEPTYNQMPFAQLLTEALCVCPFHNTHVSRLPVVDEFGKKAGEELLKFIPKDGHAFEHMEWALEGSPHPGLLLWCRWLFQKTGNVWLDRNDHQFTDWSRETVDDLAKAWPLYLELDKQMKDFDKWLTGQLQAHTAQIVRYVAKRMEKRPKTLAEVFGEGERVRINV